MKESILRSVIRTFFNTLVGVIGVLIGIFLVSLAFSLSHRSYDIQDKTNVVILPDANGVSKILSEQTPVILQIDIDDVISSEGIAAADIQSSLYTSRQGPFKNNRVKGILLHIDSPGGSVFEADEIYRAILAYKEAYQVPVHAYVSGYCASGGFYIACAADTIAATPTSLIGSVGVLSGPYINFYDLMSTHGIQSKLLSAGNNKAPFLPFTKWPEGEAEKQSEEPLRHVVAAYYDRFVDIVTLARPKITKQALVDEYGANVYIAQTAENLGYIDSSNATRAAALIELAKAAGIEEGTAYQCVKIHTVHPFFVRELVQGKMSSLKSFFSKMIQHPSPRQKFFYLAE